MFDNIRLVVNNSATLDHLPFLLLAKEVRQLTSIEPATSDMESAARVAAMERADAEPSARLQFRARIRRTWTNPRRIIPILVLGFAVAFNLWSLLPEATIAAPSLNDYVLHLLNLSGTVAALRSGQNATDFWLAPVSLGYPLFHYYQSLPSLLRRLSCASPARRRMRCGPPPPC